MKSSITRLVLLTVVLGFVMASCGSKEKCPAFTSIEIAQSIDS